MGPKRDDIIMQNRVFIWVALATALILLVPFLAMQFHVRLPDPGGSSDEVNWSLLDFFAMGVLLFGMGSMFVLAARKVRKKEHRVAVGIALMSALLLVWVELAVGIIGTPFAGS